MERKRGEYTQIMRSGKTRGRNKGSGGQKWAAVS